MCPISLPSTFLYYQESPIRSPIGIALDILKLTYLHHFVVQNKVIKKYPLEYSVKILI